jgi:hypothetical protein
MLDMLCVEALVIGIVRMLLKRQQLFSTGYDVSASLNATFFALVLARFEPLLTSRKQRWLQGVSIPQKP